MAINGYRNKPFGPGGGTRRLHHMELLMFNQMFWLHVMGAK